MNTAQQCDALINSSNYDMANCPTSLSRERVYINKRTAHASFERPLMNIVKKCLSILALAAIALPITASASDHDDGISRVKSRNRNLTDLYAFREDNQTGRAGDAGNLVIIMNSDPRAPGGRQEYFDPSSTYDLHFTQVAAANKNVAPSGIENYILRFIFAAPDSAGRQTFSTSLIHRAAIEAGGGDIMAAEPKARTTTLEESKNNQLVTNSFRTKSGAVIDVFAGLREDPFFFDVDQFLKVRAGALGRGPVTSFRTADKAVDFTVGFNVNTIVARIPISILQNGMDSPIFDVWETISVGGKQVERLARPAINEGLIVTNSFLNAFNSIPPSADMSAAAAPVRAEAVKSLIAFDKIDGKMDIPPAKIVGAFLPDVMRIDTRVSVPVGKTAYNADTSGSLGMLTAGRKLEDDVMDITLSLLVAGDATGKAVTDNVSYTGTRGNPNQGHKKLWQQKSALGPAMFPFLASPN
jgi:hypothetical protein